PRPRHDRPRAGRVGLAQDRQGDARVRDLGSQIRRPRRLGDLVGRAVGLDVGGVGRCVGRGLGVGRRGILARRARLAARASSAARAPAAAGPTGAGRGGGPRLGAAPPLGGDPGAVAEPARAVAVLDTACAVRLRAGAAAESEKQTGDKTEAEPKTTPRHARPLSYHAPTRLSMADTLRYGSHMRPSIRRTLLLVACLVGAVVDTRAASAVDAAKPRKSAPRSAPEKEAEAFLTTVTNLLAPVAVSANLADWTSLTDVTPEHTGQRTGADKALAALAGSKLIIEKTKALLKNRKQLEETTARQLERLLLDAAESPGTIPEVVTARVEAEARQASIMDGYTFCAALPTPGKTQGACPRPITANEIDDILRKSRDLNERLRIWTASKEIGRPLKPGLVELVKLR